MSTQYHAWMLLWLCFDCSCGAFERGEFRRPGAIITHRTCNYCLFVPFLPFSGFLLFSLSSFFLFPLSSCLLFSCSLVFSVPRSLFLSVSRFHNLWCSCSLVLLFSFFLFLACSHVLARSPILLFSQFQMRMFSVSFTVSVLLSPCLYVSVCLSLSLSVSRCLCLSRSVSVSPAVLLPRCLAVSLSHSIAVSLSHCLALSLYVFFVFTLRRIYFWDGVPGQNPIFRMVLSLGSLWWASQTHAMCLVGKSVFMAPHTSS